MKIWQITPKNIQDPIWESEYIAQEYRAWYPIQGPLLKIRAPDQNKARNIATEKFFLPLGLFKQKNSVSIAITQMNNNSPFDNGDLTICEEIGTDDDDREGIINIPD